MLVNVFFCWAISVSVSSLVCAPRHSRQPHRPAEEHPTPQCCQRNFLTFLESRRYALGCWRKPRPSDIISSICSSSSSLRVLHSLPSSSPCHSKGLQLPPHISLLPRASFLPKISSLAFLVPPTNSLPRFVCDDCSDCGLCLWFPCLSSLSNRALLSTSQDHLRPCANRLYQVHSNSSTDDSCDFLLQGIDCVQSVPRVQYQMVSSSRGNKLLNALIFESSTNLNSLPFSSFSFSYLRTLGSH